MLKQAGGIAAGFAGWSVLWLVAGAAAQAATPDAFAEGGSTRSGGVLAALLLSSMICSLVAGVTVSKITGGRGLGAPLILGVLLLAVGIAVQAGSWDAMPLWYHLIFLALLVPLTLAGASLVKPRVR